MAEEANVENPYGLTLYSVTSPTGSDFHLQTPGEAAWYERQRDQYMAHNRFTNVSDLEDLSRLLTLEIMVYRWTTWLTQGFDYMAGRINETELKGAIKDYCVDEQTEILTRRGWMVFTEIIPGEDVLAYDTQTGLTTWTSIQNLHVFVPSEPLLLLESRDHSSLSTSGHRWWVQRATRDRRIRSTWEWRTTEEFDRYCWIPTAAPHRDYATTPKYSDSFVELVAWWWTEGYADSRLHNGEISQSHRVNPANVMSIRIALTAECGAPGNLKRGALWNETRRDGMTLFNLSTRLVRELASVAPQKVVSVDFLSALSKAQLELFIAKSLDADGIRLPGGGARMWQVSRPRMDAFQAAVVLSGRQSTLRKSKNGYGLNLSLKRDAARPQRARSVDDYKGLVWCPETQFGTWIARRQGAVFVTGNSTEIRQVKASMGIDRVTRERDKGETTGDYIANLLRRAKEFGVHRDSQYSKAVTFLWELISMVQTHDRCDDQERRELDLSPNSIVQWVRQTVIPEWDGLNKAFRGNQRIWIGEL